MADGKPKSALDENILTEKTDEVLRKVDAEARVRKLDGFTAKMLTCVAVLMSIFHLYMAGLGTMPAHQQRMLHLAFAMFIIFLSYPFMKNSKKIGVIDYLFAFLGVGVNLYIFFNVDGIAARAGLTTQTDIIFGFLTVVLVLEAARRCIGPELPILSVLFLAYAYLGPHLPGDFMHRGYSFRRLSEHMYISAEGIYGIALGVSSTFIFLFILFGAFLSATGLSELITKVSLAVAGHKPGGPAKVAILGSGFVGMINGSAAANVVTTGAFTIPLMKRVGYKPHFAGAVEATSSTAGQMMPPVMGAAAFIMSEFLGIPYRTIMLASIFPSLLFFVAIWIFVHQEAVKTGLLGLPKDQLPDAKLALKKSGHLLVPIALLIYLLLDNYTPSFAAFYSILALIAVSFLRKHTRMSIKPLIAALEAGARQAVGVAIACAVVGIIVGVVSLTGIGLQLANMILRLSGGMLLPTLIFAMIACIVVGLGMPTSAAYIVAGTVVAPAMIRLGISPLVAHMFVFYYAILSAITPPVALASYAAAALADAPTNKVSWTAVRLGLAGFVVPFMFVYSPALLAQSDNWLEIFRSFVTASIGIYCLACFLQGYLLKKTNYIERVILFGCTVLFINGSILFSCLGIALLTTLLVRQKFYMHPA